MSDLRKVAEHGTIHNKIQTRERTIMFEIMFGVILCIFVVFVIRGIVQWNSNNKSPRLIVPAVVVSKRANVSHHHHANAGDASGAHGFSTTTSTTYYVTFQVESGDRMEFCVKASEYGMIAQGDCGTLMFQGTRYLGFER